MYTQDTVKLENKDVSKDILFNLHSVLFGYIIGVKNVIHIVGLGINLV